MTDSCRTEFEPWEDYYDLLEEREKDKFPEHSKIVDCGFRFDRLKEFLNLLTKSGYIIAVWDHDDYCESWDELDCDCAKVLRPIYEEDIHIIATALGVDWEELQSEVLAMAKEKDKEESRKQNV